MQSTAAVYGSDMERLPSTEPGGLRTAPTGAELTALIEAVARRDSDAFARLYDATVERVYAIAVAIVRQAEDAEDVAIEVFQQVWRQASRFDGTRSSVMGWMGVICRSRALDLLRRRRVRGEVAPATDQADAEPGPDSLLELVEHSSGLHEALADLGEVPRQLLAMAYFRDMTHQEIAAATGLPLGTVKSHLRRSLSRLRSLLKEPLA